MGDQLNVREKRQIQDVRNEVDEVCQDLKTKHKDEYTTPELRLGHGCSFLC